MAQLIVYSKTSDGYLKSPQDNTYLTAHNAANAASIDDTSDNMQTGQNQPGGETYYEVTRGGLFFDTSALPDTAVISSAVLALYVWHKADFQNADYLVVVDGSVLSDPMEVADFGDLLVKTTSGGSIQGSSISAGAYNNITLNATGRGWISKTGVTKLGLRSQKDINSDDPFAGFNELLLIYCVEKGADYRPKLTIDYYSAWNKLLLDDDLTDHTALPDAHHTEFTITEHDVAARHPLANLDPLVCSEAEADSKVAAHKALTTGVHGGGIGDADGDTKIQTEESADEDKIRMDVKGVEAFLLHDDGILDLVKQSGCSVYRATNQAIANATAVKVQLDTELYDIQGEFDPTTNYRFTAKKAGYYLVAAAVNYVTFPADKKIQVYVAKNGAYFAINEVETAIVDYISAFVLAITHCAVNDYIELFTAHWGGASYNLRGAAGFTFMNIHKLA